MESLSSKTATVAISEYQFRAMVKLVGEKAHEQADYLRSKATRMEQNLGWRPES